MGSLMIDKKNFFAVFKSKNFEPDSSKRIVKVPISTLLRIFLLAENVLIKRHLIQIHLMFQDFSFLGLEDKKPFHFSDLTDFKNDVSVF